VLQAPASKFSINQRFIRSIMHEQTVEAHR
jgi:hypothetical protein